MAKRTDRNARAEYLGKQGGRMSVRQRLKHTIEVADRYSRLLGASNVLLSETQAKHQAARYAARWYRERWIFTVLTLIIALLAVAGGLVAK